MIHETYNNAMYHATRDKNIIEASKENPIIQSLDLRALKSNKPKLLSIKDPKFKFEKYKKDQSEKISNDEKKQNEFLKWEQEKNSTEIHSLESKKHNTREESDLAQLEQWRKNMEIKKSFEIRLHNELHREANFFKQLVFESIGNSQKEEKTQVENFEKNLSRLGLDVSNAELKLKKSNKAAVSGEIILQKIREKIEANAVAKKERDRRKRKIFIEQKKAQEELLKNEKKTLNSAFENKSLESAFGATEAAEAKLSEFKAWKDLHGINEEFEAEKRKETETLEKERNKNYDEIFAEFFSLREKNSKQIFDKKEFIVRVYCEDRMQKEKEMEARNAKRAKNLIPIKKITNQILEIADEVFKFQTDFNIELLDDSYWKELMKGFVNNSAQSMRAEKPALESYFDAPQANQDKKSENTLENVSRSKFNESQQEIISVNNNANLNNNINNNKYALIIEGVFEDCELFDYLNFIGQYKTENVIPGNVFNKMLDLFEIMGNDLQQLLAGSGSKYGKIADVYKEYEPTDDDIENLTIPAVYVKNYNLNDIVNILVDLKFLNANMQINNNLSVFNNQAIATQNNLIGFNNNNNNSNNFLAINNININANNVNIINNNNILNITSNSATFNNTNNNNTNNNNNYLSVNTIQRSNLQSSPSNKENNNNNNINNNQIKSNIMNNTNSNLNLNTIKTNQNQNLISNLFNSIPLKILFLGKKFSGRKTQIKSLCESFPLKFYNIEELITKNMQFLEELEIPFEENPKYKNLKKNDLEKALQERQQDETKFEALKPFVKPLKEFFDKALKIPNEIIFDFISEIIKADFPAKSQQQILEELNQKHKKKKELLEELAKIKDEKSAKGAAAAAAAKNASGKNETFYINEIQKLNVETNKGFVLLDFPGGLEQAKFFEHKINNFVSETEKPKNFVLQLKENFGLILDKIPKPSQNRTLAQGAFDLVFFSDVADDEALRRAKNRKLDPITGIVYHMQDNPPPVEDKKLNERLVAFEENIDFEALLDTNGKFEKEADALVEFYEAFGFQKANFRSLHRFPFTQGVGNLNNFNANNNNESIYTASNLNNNNNNRNLVTERSEKTGMTNNKDKESIILNTHNSNLNGNNNNPKKNKDVKEQLLSMNAEMKEIVLHMIKINEERESEFLASATQNSKESNHINNLNNNNNTNNPNNSNFAKDPFTNTTNSQLNQNTNTNINLIATNNNNTNHLLNNSRRNSVSMHSNQKDLQKSKEQLNNNNNNLVTQSHLRINTEAEASNNFNSKNNFVSSMLPKSNQTLNNIQNLDEEDFNKYNKKLEEAKRKLAGLTVESIFAQWAKMHSQFFCEAKNFFKNLRKQKESIISTFNRMQEKFVDFLRRPSRKMQDINKFQKKYNKFFDEYPQLHGDEHVKAEFHQDVSDLSDLIWDAIEERKSEAIAERRKIMDSGYVEKEFEKFYFNLEKLFSLEVEKFVTNVNTIRDFYWGMDLKNINMLDNLGFSPLEVLKDFELLSLPIYLDDAGESNLNSSDKVHEKKFNGVKQGKGVKANLANRSDEKYSSKINSKKNNNNNKNKENNEHTDFKYPRVQKLFNNSIKIILKLDENLKSMEKIGKNNALNNISSESSIRKMSRIHLRRNHETTFVDDKREIFIYEEEMKNSLKFEKNKFKYRVTFLKFWAVEYFENLRKISKLVYDKLDDWIISTIKAENDAMNNLVTIFDGCIEKEMRLRVDFEMDSFEIYKLIDVNDKIEILVKNFFFK